MIWCDLDGVLVDFVEGYYQRFGEYPAPIDGDQNVQWDRVRSCPDFFSQLPWTPFGREIWKRIDPLGAHILTAVAKSIPDCAEQKINWCRRELAIGPERVTAVLGKRNKFRFFRPGDILLDNQEQLISDWEKAGGRGFLITPENAIAQADLAARSADVG